MEITIEIPVKVLCSQTIELSLEEYNSMFHPEEYIEDPSEDEIRENITDYYLNNGEIPDFGDKYIWDHEFIDEYPDEDEIDIKIKY